MNFARAHVVFWILGLAVGCTASDPAQLVVVVRTDMSVPTELDTILVELLEANGDVRESHPLDLRDAMRRLPLSFGIAPWHGDIDRPVHLRISAIRRGGTLFRTEVRTRFVSRRVNRLDVFLARMCTELECSENQTCRRDGCDDIDIPSTELELHDPDAGGVDGGRDAAGRDAGVDAASADAGPDAMCPSRGPTIIVPLDPPARTCEIGASGTCRELEDCEAIFSATAFCSPHCSEDSDCVGYGTGSICDPGFNCTHPCNPLTNEGCPPSTVCGVGIEYLSECGRDRLNYVTTCRFVNSSAVIGDACDDVTRMGQGDCGERQVCSAAVCTQLCDMESDCTEGWSCCPLTGAEGGLIIGGQPIGRCRFGCADGVIPL